MFLPEEVKFFQSLAEDMAKRIADATTSNSASVACSKIGRVCARVVADDAAISAKRTTRADNVNKFQEARQTRRQAKKGGTTPPQSHQEQPQAQKRA